jgi:hypothetical protein
MILTPNLWRQIPKPRIPVRVYWSSRGTAHAEPVFSESKN